MKTERELLGWVICRELCNSEDILNQKDNFDRFCRRSTRMYAPKIFKTKAAAEKKLASLGIVGYTREYWLEKSIGTFNAGRAIWAMAGLNR
jgi:hypothetical protein